MKRTKKKTVSVVTGGAGFLGSHLCDLLLAKGHDVICLDNLITGNVANIEHLSGNSHFKFIKHDVTEYIYLPGKVNYIFHFASPASPIDYLELPIQTLKVGALGTHKALGLARAKKAVFLLASTSEVYGDPVVHPQKESYWGNVNPVGPRGVYDEAKRFAEIKVARIFNTYGPRMHPNDGRVVPAFIKQALEGVPLTVFGDGRQTRSFCYVSDLIAGIYALVMSGKTGPINIGNPEEMTVLQLAEKIAKLTGSRSRIVFKALPVDDPRVRQPDISLAKKFLRWKPKVNIDEGLPLALKYFKSVAETGRASR